ncbi:pyocin S6 family toxin immunity protein [Pseudomonas chlororaphis subsp. piscium]
MRALSTAIDEQIKPEFWRKNLEHEVIMYLCISGFLPSPAEDDSIKYELDIDAAFNEQIVQLLGHESLEAMAEGLWPLTNEQVAQISELIGQALPGDLEMLIGVEE